MIDAKNWERLDAMKLQEAKEPGDRNRAAGTHRSGGTRTKLLFHDTYWEGASLCGAQALRAGGLLYNLPASYYHLP